MKHRIIILLGLLLITINLMSINAKAFYYNSLLFPIREVLNEGKFLNNYLEYWLPFR